MSTSLPGINIMSQYITFKQSCSKTPPTRLGKRSLQLSIANT